MNNGAPTADDSWGGRPIARRIAGARARQRVVVTGKIVDAQLRIWRGSAARVYAIDDGTGRMAVVFGGLLPIPGMVEGTRCTVEGTALADEQGIALWYP